MLSITHATSAEDVDVVRSLLREYQSELGVDLGFQHFEAELRDLPGAYQPPDGRLLLARYENDPVGTIASRALDGGRVEMKRLFVRPAARGLGVAKALVSRLLDEARAAGFSEMVLDTLPTMTQAQRLYEEFGFRDIPPYTVNPIPGTRFLALQLETDQPRRRKSAW